MINSQQFSNLMQQLALAWCQQDIVVELRDGKIAFWREYQQKRPAGFASFLNQQGKTWQWHIGNYP